MILKLLGVLLGVFVLANMAFIDYLVFVRETSFQNEKMATIDIAPTAAPSQVNDRFCSNACISAIENATAAAVPIKPTTAPITTKAPVQQAVSGGAAKEYYVPLGSGMSSSDEWMDIAGASAYIDSTSYPSIKKVTFEATLFTPTGNQTAYARLYDVTDKHPVWFSDVSLDGGATQLIQSQPITLDSGNKLYQVQMKTSLKFQSNLTQSRVHIITQ